MGINLDDYVVEVEGQKFIPLDIAKLAIAQSAQVETKLDDAMDMIKKALTDMNNSVTDVLKND